MGQQHNELRRGEVSRALKNALGDTRQGGLERYGETLTPAIDLWGRPEWAFLRDEHLWGFSQTVAAVVGEQGGVAVVNPAGSNRIVVVEGATGQSVVANIALQLALTTEAVITATYALFAGGGLAMPNRDTRSVPGVTFRMPLPQFWTGTNIGALITTNLRIDIVRTPTAEVFPFHALPVILSPGSALLIEDSGANEAFTVGMFGYIRAAYPGEL